MFFTEVTTFQQTVAATEWLWVSDTQRKHSLVCKINKTSYYRKQTNYWNCWFTRINFVMFCYESGLFWMVFYEWSVI